MHKLKSIYDRLSIFDKSFLDMYYKLKLDNKSKRWKFYQKLKGITSKSQNEFNNELQETSSGAMSQIKRRVKNDIESVILFRLLNGTDSDDKNSKHMLYRNLILAEYYLENEMFDDCRKKLNQVSRIVDNDSFMCEKLLYNELQGKLESVLGKQTDTMLYNDTLSTLKTIELRVAGEMELSGFADSKFETNKVFKRGYDKDGIIMQDYYRDVVIPTRRIIKKEWKEQNYEKALEGVRDLYNDVGGKCPDYKQIELECLIYQSRLNVYMRLYDENIRVFDKITSDYKLNAEHRKELNTLRFMASFLDGYLEDCKTIYGHMLSDRTAFLNPNDIGLLRYFKCLILFWNGKYSDMRNVIAGESKLFSLPDNVGVNVRLLEMYSLIVEGDYELCKYRLESFRQAINRRITTVSVRYHLIERLLYSIITTGNTNKVWNKYNKLKETYGSDDVRFNQDIEGYELVSVEEFVSLYEMKTVSIEQEKKTYV
ncbi:MAG: hypothetical protein N4A72_18655 [Bacteroidales bacterium]|jgi:hypothetical protein|nr:hypothetical protein [Bacteroidales bacterium]